jgi:hypothetical protein
MSQEKELPLDADLDDRGVEVTAVGRWALRASSCTVYASYTQYLSDPACPRPPTKEDAGRPGHQRRRRPPWRRSLNTTVPSSEGTRGLHRVAGYDPPWTSSPPSGPGGRFPLDGVQHRNTLTRPRARHVQTTSTEGRASCYRSTHTPARKPGAPPWLLVEASLSPRGWDGGVDLTRDGRTGETRGRERRGRGWGNMIRLQRIYNF